MNEELYFKDAFTEVDGSINLEVNNLKANCITSNNNKFSLDSEGNLVVNSITTKQSNDSNIDFDMIYPVGSIYFSVNNVNPGTLFGGVWERFANGRTLVGVDEAQAEFNVVKKEGGEKFHTLSMGEMPKHNHTVSLSGGPETTKKITFSDWAWKSSQRQDVSYAFDDSGNNQAHNNLQPYLTCYIWTRIS